MRSFLLLAAAFLAGCGQPPATAPGGAPLAGRLLYGDGDGGTFHIYLEHHPAAGAPVRLLQGRFPRWSPDGERFAFVRRAPDSLWVANADGSGERKVTENIRVADHGLTCPHDWHPDGLRLVHNPLENGGNGLALTTVATGRSTLIGDTTLPYSGEPQYSADGKRLHVRGTKGFIDGLSWRPVLSVDTATNEHTIYAIGCCSSVSPSGDWAANNTPLHRYMDIWSADFKNAASLRAKTVLPTHGLWDDWHWTNHDRYITTRSDGFPQTGVPDDAFLIDVVEQAAIPLTTGARGTDWPDFYVDSAPGGEVVVKTVPRDAAAEIEAFKRAKRRSAQGVPTIVVRAKLRAITPVPPVETRAYPNYLVDAEWELLETLTDEWLGSRFTGVHYAVREGEEVPGTAALEKGATRTLTVQAWDAREDLHTLGRLGPDTLDLDRKEFFVLAVE